MAQGPRLLRRTRELGEPTFRCVRARRDDDKLADLLVDIDLQSFIEPTMSHVVAGALVSHGEVFLLLANEDVIGFATCMRTWDPADEAVLVSMGLRPGWRGRGLGQRFVRDVFDAMAVDGVSAVTLIVGSDNLRAVRLYRDLGFEIQREGDVDPYTGERALHMRARLPVEALVVGTAS